MGACEIDEYCQQVWTFPAELESHCEHYDHTDLFLFMQILARHHPGLKVHPDVRDLDLVAAAGGVRLDIVLISTPCTDVSTRGHGRAQLGQVKLHWLLYSVT